MGVMGFAVTLMSAVAMKGGWGLAVILPTARSVMTAMRMASVPFR